MSWRQRFADCIAPKAAKVAGQVEAAVDEAKDRAVVVVQTQAPGMSRRLVLFLVALSLLLLSVGGYAIYWRYLRPVKQLAGLVPVQTQGGEKTPGYTAPPVKNLGKIPRHTAIRPVQSTPVEDLPKREQGYAPVVAPVVGIDNVTRTKPELLTSSIAPPHRGDTEIRTWLNPDGSTENVVTPQAEDFFGWPWKDGNWKRFELETGPGIGGKQWDAQATWLPLRIGNFMIGARGEGWMEPDGTVKMAPTLRLRWEPFRRSYR